VKIKQKKRRQIIRIGRRLIVQPSVCLATVACVAAKGQSVISQSPQYTPPPSALLAAQNNEMQVFNPEADFLDMLQNINTFQWGPVSFHPSLSYKFLYGTGIESSPGNQQASIVQSFSPSFLFLVGSHWTLHYTPTWTFYSSKRFENSLDHMASLSWGTTYNDWVLGLSQHYSRSNDALIETGAQTEQEKYTTAAQASYQFNTKMSMDLGVNQNFNFSSQARNSASLTNSREWSTMDWLNYAFWARLNIGLGLGFGYINEDVGPDMIYEQYQGRVNWRATDKISFHLNGGLQDQQFLTSDEGDMVTPIFGASVQYQPFDQTQLSLNANRTVSASSLENQVTETTAITADLKQRLLGKLNLDLSGSYNSTKYVATIFGFSLGRTDDYYAFNARLSCPFLKRATAAVFYQYSDNSSSARGYTFSSNQVGFQLGYQF
jgi:Putative beta-barrel porin 2